MRSACWAFAGFILFAVFSGRCLYGDGAHEFIRVLEAGTFVELMKVRGLAFDCFELFLVIAIRLGVTDLHLLRLAFGIGCFLPWPLALVVCHHFAPTHFWLVALACAAGYLNAAFMPVGEHIVAHALYWIALFALLYVRPLTPWAGALLLVSAAILCRSYESLAFLGPPLAGIALWRIARRPAGKLERAVLLLAAALFIIASTIAMKGVLYPEIPANFGDFKHGILAELLSPGWTSAWSGVWILLLLVVLLSPTVRRGIAYRVSLFLLACGLAIWGLGPILVPSLLMPGSQQRARFLELVVPLVLLPVALALSWQPTRLGIYRSWLMRFSASFLLAQSLWQLSATWQWTGFVGTVRGILGSRTGPVLLAATPLADVNADGYALGFDWSWANPCLSIALSPGGQVRSLILSPTRPGWQPFDPLDAQQLPRLERYGVDYRRYVASLVAGRPPEHPSGAK